VRGGIVYFNRLKRDRPQVQGIVTATRGNHGQSLAFAGARAGIAVTIVVPRGNSTEKNAAMRSLGAEVVEYGRDFDEAKEHAVQIAAERGDEYAPSFTVILSSVLRPMRMNCSGRLTNSIPSMCPLDWAQASAA
jgi:threonine dehydratase